MNLPTPRLLLASHGTVGACAAETLALALVTPGSTLIHLTVVPEFWRGMMGDDWLNNVATRDAFCRHVESQLASEIGQHQNLLESRVRATGASYASHIVIGNPADCLLALAAETDPGLVVVGSPRPRGVPGLRSRMRVEGLVTGLKAPLLVVPFPR
jgi:nucleotide-binding universal stress UspA family protein